MLDLKTVLKELSLSFGVSGLEKEVGDKIVSYLDSYKCERDGLGNITVRVKNEGAPKLMISAHMDEVGFMINEICESGVLKFDTVGGIDPSVLLSKRVISEKGVKGAILSKPIHLLTKSEREEIPKISDMYIDIGASSKEEAEKYVMLGDYFTFNSDFVEFGHNKIKCKALDDRLGCAIMCKILDELKNENKTSKYDLYFCFTGREELGWSGARVTTSRIKPDYAIVIESTAVGDIATAEDSKKVAFLGSGGAISFADRSTIYPKDFLNEIFKICEKNNVKYQIKKYVSGGNDAGNIQKSANGTKVAVFSAPSRYIHSQSDVCDYEDIESIYQAVYAFITDKE